MHKNCKIEFHSSEMKILKMFIKHSKVRLTSFHLLPETLNASVGLRMKHSAFAIT